MNKRNGLWFLVGAVCLMVLAVIAGIVPLETLSILTLVPFLLGEAATAVGDVTETSTPDTHQVRDVSTILTEKEPHRNPLWVTLRRIRKTKRAKAEKVEWEEDDIIPRKTNVDGATAAGAAGAIKTVTVDDGAIYRVDDVVLMPANATAPDGLLQVVSISTNDVDFVRVDGGSQTAWGTVPALLNNELLVRIGNAKKEFFANSAARTTMPVTLFNFVQAEDVTIGISNRRKATANYTIDDWARSKDRQLFDFLSSSEYRLFFGRREKKTIGGENKTFAGGIDFYQSAVELTYSAATFSEITLTNWAREIFTGNKGSMIRYLHADPYLAMDLTNIGLDKVRRTQVESKTLKMGVTRLDFEGLGSLIIINEQMFAEAGKVRYGFVLDYANLEIKDLNPMKAVMLDLEKTQGLDGEALQIKEESTLLYRYDETHARITGTV